MSVKGGSTVYLKMLDISCGRFGYIFYEGIPVYTFCKGCILGHILHVASVSGNVVYIFCESIPEYTSCKGYIPKHFGHTVKSGYCIPGYTSCKGYIPTDVGTYPVAGVP